jgi:phospholipase/carboxylesterase
MDLVHHVRPAAGARTGALVLMHGRGTSEHDLAPLLDALDPHRRLVGLLPRGPLQLPPGGNHWYAVRQVGFPDPGTFLPTFEALVRWLGTALHEQGIDISRTILGGFSQGAVMSYALGLGAGRPAPAGILALSGFMPTVEGFELVLDGRRGFPTAIGHGTQDQVIPVAWGRQARERLSEAGADVLYRESQVPHAVDPYELPTFTAWIDRTVGTDASAEPRPAS